MAVAATPETTEVMNKAVLKPAGVDASDEMYSKKPSVAGFKFIGGVKSEWTGPMTDVTSPIFDTVTGARSVRRITPNFSGVVLLSRRMCMCSPA
jgi:hypothetical protein